MQSLRRLQPLDLCRAAWGAKGTGHWTTSKKATAAQPRTIGCCWAACQEWLPKMTSIVVGCAGSHFLLQALRPTLLAA